MKKCLRFGHFRKSNQVLNWRPVIEVVTCRLITVDVVRLVGVDRFVHSSIQMVQSSLIVEWSGV